MWIDRSNKKSLMTWIHYYSIMRTKPRRNHTALFYRDVYWAYKWKI